jgi:hypothetical protein
MQKMFVIMNIVYQTQTNTFYNIFHGCDIKNKIFENCAIRGN